jgi:aminoglycoside phosphotransferase (APT) family kinase protein
MTGRRMHEDELDIDEALVRRLLSEQFPDWAGLPLARVEPSGTVNAIFRLGDELSVRLERRDGQTEPGGIELECLPRLAPLLPLEIPVPVAQGRPSAEYPWFWDVHTWVEGETVPVEEIDAVQAALDLAGFVRALRRVDSTGAPQGRGIPLAERDPGIRYWLERSTATRVCTLPGTALSRFRRGRARPCGTTVTSTSGTGSSGTDESRA